jgi:hypothetical protein
VLAGTRVDIFRSKDFLAKLRAKPPPNLDALVPVADSTKDAAKKLDAQLQKLGVRAEQLCARAGRRCSVALAQSLLIAGGLIGRVDRVIKERSKGEAPRQGHSAARAEGTGNASCRAQTR